MSETDTEQEMSETDTEQGVSKTNKMSKTMAAISFVIGVLFAPPVWDFIRTVNPPETIKCLIGNNNGDTRTLYSEEPFVLTRIPESDVRLKLGQIGYEIPSELNEDANTQGLPEDSGVAIYFIKSAGAWAYSDLGSVRIPRPVVSCPKTFSTSPIRFNNGSK